MTWLSGRGTDPRAGPGREAAATAARADGGSGSDPLDRGAGQVADEVSGSYTVTNKSTAIRIYYHNTQFTNDVYLNGQVTLDTINTLNGRVALIGPGERAGTLTVHAVLWDPAHPASLARRHRRRQGHRRSHANPMIRSRRHMRHQLAMPPVAGGEIVDLLYEHPSAQAVSHTQTAAAEAVPAAHRRTSASDRS
jgi:hypothetical protein